MYANNLGRSFTRKSNEGYHRIEYDMRGGSGIPDYRKQQLKMRENEYRLKEPIN